MVNSLSVLPSAQGHQKRSAQPVAHAPAPAAPAPVSEPVPVASVAEVEPAEATA